MRFYDECGECLLKSQIEKIGSERTEEETAVFLRECEHLCSVHPAEYSAPLLVRDMDAAYRRLFNKGIDYTEEKKASNSVMLGLEDAISEHVEKSSDRLYEAIKFAMAANYIDFAHITSFDSASVSYVMEAAERAEPDKATLQRLKNDLARGREIVFLHDNCGEIVLDKILISVIARLYPGIIVYSVFRGGPIINDATVIDAMECGMGRDSLLLSSGSAIPGTYLKAVSRQTLGLLDRADVIISKGLGNLETLCDEKYRPYYMFMAKCAHIAERFGCRVHDTILYHEGE